MRQARGQAQKNGRIVALAQFKSALNIIMAFLAVGRLQHGDVRRAGDHAAVLFILAGMHIGIVRRHDHHPRVHARIGRGIQGIGRHIDAHMLHAAHGARARHGRAEGRFHSHLFVGGPFAVDLRVLGQWGNGTDRQQLLTAAGYDYAVVQEKVNRLLNRKSVDQIAREVIRGSWGNGNERINRLKQAGYDSTQIQKRVNQLL